MDVIPELSAFWNTFQSDIATAVAKHGDIQFIFDHYIQVNEAHIGTPRRYDKLTPHFS